MILLQLEDMMMVSSRSWFMIILQVEKMMMMYSLTLMIHVLITAGKHDDDLLTLRLHCRHRGGREGVTGPGRANTRLPQVGTMFLYSKHI